MMITTMMKISVFVLAGMISGSSATPNSQAECRAIKKKEDCTFPCYVGIPDRWGRWTCEFYEFGPGIEDEENGETNAFVSMEAVSSAQDWCRQFDNKPKKCSKHPAQCKWKPAKDSWKPNLGHCVFRSGVGSRATAPSFVSLEADVDGEEDYAATSSAHDDDIYFFDDNLFEPDDNGDASGSDDNDASDIKKYLRAN